MTTAGLLRAAAPQLVDPSSAAPLVPLYLLRRRVYLCVSGVLYLAGGLTAWVDSG